MTTAVANNFLVQLVTFFLVGGGLGFLIGLMGV
jgi:hypothetical protein